jgi:hypothetical protein
MAPAPVVAASAMAVDTTHTAPRFDRAALFQVVGSMYSIDPALLTAIAAVESHSDSSAVSPAGAQGLMQLMPATARKFHVSDPFDPIDNTLGAARYLDYLSRRRASRTSFGVSLVELLAAYNAGEQAVAEYDGVPPYPETREYVRRVLVAYLLETLISPPGSPQSPRSLATNRLASTNQPPIPSNQRTAVPEIRQRRTWAPPQPLDVLEQLARIRRERGRRLGSQPASTDAAARSR